MFCPPPLNPKTEPTTNFFCPPPHPKTVPTANSSLFSEELNIGNKIVTSA